jgi:hypothetical protein
METKEEREKKQKAYIMTINSVYGYSNKLSEGDFYSLYVEYTSKQKQENRDKKIDEILK